MEELRERLRAFPRKTIKIEELEQFVQSAVHSYEEFARIVLELEKEQVLTMVKAKGRTSRVPSLAFQYRIDKVPLIGGYHKELLTFRQTLHPSLSIDAYYRLEPSVWSRDLPMIEKVSEYLYTHGFPEDVVPAPERSYELVGDEKWIVEKGGKQLLERVKLFHKLNIIPVSEPLMFAINPFQIHTHQQFHLIVENKTTYQGLLPSLKETIFSTLIYGSGMTIVSSIEQFENQYPVQAKHHFFYFGDIDRSGISIWHSLNKRVEVSLALSFYRACLTKVSAVGKDYQTSRKDAEDHFLSCFKEDEQTLIKEVLTSGRYFPQETLKTKELQQIWRNSDWTE